MGSKFGTMQPKTEQKFRQRQFLANEVNSQKLNNADVPGPSRLSNNSDKRRINGNRIETSYQPILPVKTKKRSFQKPIVPNEQNIIDRLTRFIEKEKLVGNEEIPDLDFCKDLIGEKLHLPELEASSDSSDDEDFYDTDFEVRFHKNLRKNIPKSPQKSPGKISKSQKHGKSVSKSPKKKISLSPLKTRGIVATSDAEEDTICCYICEESEGELIKCSVCENDFHRECIQVEASSGNKSWRCSDCIRCSKCLGYIDDAENVQCITCRRVFHGKCKSDGLACDYPFKTWKCLSCITKNQRKNEMEVFKRNRSFKNKPKMGKIQTNSEIFIFSSSNKVHRQKLRKMINVTESAFEISPKILVVPKNMSKMDTIQRLRKRKALRKLNDQVNDRTLKIALKKIDQNGNKTREIAEKLTRKFSATLMNYQALWPKNIEEKTIKQNSIKVNRSKKRKYAANLIHGRKMRHYLSQFSFPDFLDSYTKIKQNALDLYKHEKVLYDSWISVLHFDNEIRQYLHFGPKHIVPVKTCVSSIDSEICGARLIFVCHKCFELFLMPFKFRIHLNMCNYSCPPGNEIYRETLQTSVGEQVISFFEVVGTEDKEYCRRLCEVASSLLPAKTMTEEVGLFKFYVLTEFHDESGFVPVGFFSKEDKPSQNNNLSCLLVFNHFRTSGYGKLLVDTSYLLSKKERKFGSPEHPLSDDGLILYRSYWKSVLFQYLRKNRTAKKLSIDDISKETHIFVDDVVSTLLVNEMVKQTEEGKIYIDCAKAWYTDLQILRRRRINEELLDWEPQIDPNEEYNKYYVWSSDEEL